MMRMKTASIVEQRSKYMWGMANLCHIDVLRIDQLRVLDFYQYIASIDQYNAALKKRNESQR
jgi:hypothetical protein